MDVLQRTEPNGDIFKVSFWLEVIGKTQTHTHKQTHCLWHHCFFANDIDQSCVDSSVTQRSVLNLLMTPLIPYLKLIGWWLIDRTENVDWPLASAGMSEGLFIKLIISLVMIGVIAEESLSSQVLQHWVSRLCLLVGWKQRFLTAASFSESKHHIL